MGRTAIAEKPLRVCIGALAEVFDLPNAGKPEPIERVFRVLNALGGTATALRA